MQQLTGLDAAMLYTETARTPNHVAAFYTYDPSSAPGGSVSFDAIGGMPARMGADVITTVYAKMRGYRTQTFRDLPVRHLRPMATADGVRRGRRRQGAYQYIVYYPVTWALLRALVVAARFRPYGLSGFWYLQGYLGAALSRSARVDDPEWRAFARAEQRERSRAGIRRSLKRLRGGALR